MDFLGIGPLELIIILLVGFLIFGPEKLPRMAASAGRRWQQFRKAAFDVTRAVTEEAEAALKEKERPNPPPPQDKKQ